MTPEGKSSAGDIAERHESKAIRIAIVAARWNEHIVQRLIDGALSALRQKEVAEQNIVLLRCPGSYELPLVIKKCLDTRSFDAAIALGVVIRGDTYHFELISNAVSQGIAQVMLESGVPCIFGVLTTDTVEQALARAGDGVDNKGYETALAALEMIQVLDNID